MYGGKLILPALWLSLWNALLQVGAMIGSLANGPLADRFGRRIAFSIGGLIGCIGMRNLSRPEVC
jgi:SP family general alpha glucoside:H+ symporter-like MFS transporter